MTEYIVKVTLCKDKSSYYHSFQNFSVNSYDYNKVYCSIEKMYTSLLDEAKFTDDFLLCEMSTVLTNVYEADKEKIMYQSKILDVMNFEKVAIDKKQIKYNSGNDNWVEVRKDTFSQGFDIRLMTMNPTTKSTIDVDIPHILHLKFKLVK
jgi:hypothetical protein